MPLPTITRRLEIDAGHRLLRHAGKCKNYHGHRYVFEIECASDIVGEDGMVIDFSIVKQLVGTWLDVELDHGMILERGDPMIALLTDMGSKVYIVEFAPTAENLSRYVYEVASKLLAPHKVRVVSITCYETPNCHSRFAP